MFKAMHIVGLHNHRAGGRTRKRLLTFTKYSCLGLSQGYSEFYGYWLRFKVWLRLLVFENAFWLFDKVYGFKRVTTEIEL